MKESCRSICGVISDLETAGLWEFHLELGSSEEPVSSIMRKGLRQIHMSSTAS